MAEIKIEQKKPVWPWVIAGIVLVAIIGFFLFSNNDNKMNQTRDQSAYGTDKKVNETGRRTMTGDIKNDQKDNNRAGDNDSRMTDNMNNGTDGMNSEVAAFVNYVKDIKKNDLDHQRVSEAFSQLTAATTSVATESGINAAKDLAEAKQHIAMINKNPYETAPAEHIRKSADIITAELQRVQQAKFPKLDKEAKNLVEAAASIKPEELAQNQSDEIKDYLTDAADLLDDMK